MTDTVAPQGAVRLPFPAAFAAAVLAPAAVSIALSAVIAAIAHAAGASHDFKALTLPAYAAFIVIGLLIGAIAWTLIRRRSAHPARLLGRLVPLVVVLSLVPDVLVGAGASMPGASWGGAVALMAMHLVVAACGVVAYRTFLPLGTGPSRGTQERA